MHPLVVRKQPLLTFLAVAALATVGSNAVGARPTGPAVVQRVRLAAQAAEVPVPQPLPLAEDLAAAPPVGAVAAVADAPIVAAPAAFTGAAPARVAAPAALQSAASSARDLQGGTWSVVIGINDYPGTQFDLQYAVNDATDAYDALRRLGAGDHIMFLRDGQVTAGVLRNAIAWLTNHAGPDATAVFYYAGHVRKDRGAETIVTSDGSSVSDVELASWLRPLAARKTWITMATCYGGGFTELLAPGRVLTAAAGADSAAYESSALGRSYLGEYMVRRALLQGTASGSVQHAFSWAYAKIHQEYPGREPVQFDQTDGFLNLTPAGATAAPPPPSNEPQPSQQPSQPPPSQEPSEPAPPPSSCRLFCFR